MSSGRCTLMAKRHLETTMAAVISAHAQGAEFRGSVYSRITEERNIIRRRNGKLDFFLLRILQHKACENVPLPLDIHY